MNIKDAKQQIRNAVTAYLAKDELGIWEIPPEQQRPIFMIGAPGIGKTAIMKQISEELGIGLVSYSMTHHTRQSALGLPRIIDKPWGTVTEYTMSEILSSVYDEINHTGIREGILFLDEINCVSDTLAPSMLQFLQFKTFGQHHVPEGWIIVTAGNPPEYNRSVREFDVVMLDRLKVITVTPDYSVWREYASSREIHRSVTGFLDARKDAFYLVENTPEGKQYVTARGWEDLSSMLRLYEKREIPVDDNLIGQYICSRRICADFAAYYALYEKYTASFSVEEILNGDVQEDVLTRAKAARFDERYAVLGLLLDSLSNSTKDILRKRRMLEMLLPVLQKIKAAPEDGLHILLDAESEIVKKADRLSRRDRHASVLYTECLDSMKTMDYPNMKNNFAERLSQLQTEAEITGNRLQNAIQFCEQVFGDQEMLILITEMTINPNISGYIANYGSEKYFEHNQDLMFYERKKEIDAQLESLDLSSI